jgi:hypothetical protein
MQKPFVPHAPYPPTRFEFCADQFESRHVRPQGLWEAMIQFGGKTVGASVEVSDFEWRPLVPVGIPAVSLETLYQGGWEVDVFFTRSCDVVVPSENRLRVLLVLVGLVPPCVLVCVPCQVCYAVC